MGQTRLFHTVVIVGSGLFASCGKGTDQSAQSAPPAAGSSAKSADDAAAPQPADAAAADATPVDAGVDAPVDAAARPDARTKRAPQKPRVLKKPPDYIRIMVSREAPEIPRIQAIE